MADDVPVGSVAVGLEGESLYRLGTGEEGSGQSQVNERVPASKASRHTPCPSRPGFANKQLPRGLVTWVADPHVLEAPADCTVGDRMTKGVRGGDRVTACRRRSRFRDLFDMGEKLLEKWEEIRD